MIDMNTLLKKTYQNTNPTSPFTTNRVYQ